MLLRLLTACTPGHAFDGVDDHLVVDVHDVDGAALTVEARVYPEAGGPPMQDVVARRAPEGGRDAFTFRIRGDMGAVLELGLASGGRTWGTAGTHAVPTGRWTALAVTHDRSSGQVCFYLDGAVDRCDHSPIPPGTGDGLVTWIGGDPLRGPTGRPFKGRIADVRIWSVVRTPEQVRADAATTPAAGTPGVVYAGL